MKNISEDLKKGVEQIVKDSQPKPEYAVKMVKCPNCKKDIDENKLKLEHHPEGRQTFCPKCKKKILISFPVKRLARDESGCLVARFPNAKKGPSKKERCRARKEAQNGK